MSKAISLILLAAVVAAVGCGRTEKAAAASGAANPLLAEFDTPFGVPAFDRIRIEHFRPALEQGMAAQKAEVAAIVSNPEPPTFANTVEALERSGALLSRAAGVFFNLTSALTNEDLQRLEREIAPLLAKHRDDIALDPGLFERVKAVHEAKSGLGLPPEQARLLDETYKDFVRGGANLPAEKRDRFRAINEELSVLTVRFGENILKETNAFELVLESEADLAGLPPAVVSAAAETAAERGKPGRWVFTLHKPSLIPFLQYSERRDLREKIFTAYIKRGDNGGELDNNAAAARIAALRAERAALLGYRTHAAFVLEENMAKTPAAVTEFLDRLWTPARAKALAEAAELQSLARETDPGFELRPWDWWFYAEKLRKAKYDLDDAELRPYFQLESVRNGAYAVATKLFGITFEERTDLPKYHEDVRTFEVKDADGSHLAVLYVDYFPRASKQGGAWMNNYREQKIVDGRDVRPVIVNVGNFSKPTAGRPALLSFEEATTLFHEFGHALHGILSRTAYESLSGTNVPRDFVELPSQIMENWATAPEVLKTYALHYETGESIPDALVAKIERSRTFNQGFETVEYLAASILDMDWHLLTEPVEPETAAFEDRVMGRIGVPPQIVSRYRSTFFNHIFSGGYSAGYYSYIWAQVLDADAFEAFKEAGLFDPETARSFRTNILERGGTEEPMNLYKRFRGREPRIEPLLEKRGLI